MRAVVRVLLLVLACAISTTPAAAQDRDPLEDQVRKNQAEMEGYEEALREAEQARLAGKCDLVRTYYVLFMRKLKEQRMSYPTTEGPPADLPPKTKADFKRRMEEIAARDCPPGSGINSLGESMNPNAEDSGDIFDNPDNAKAGVGLTPMDEPGNSAPPAGGPQPRPKTPEPEPSSDPETDDSGDIFDDPDNAKAGVGLTPMDEPAKSPTKGEPLDGHEPFLDEIGDETGATGTATPGKPVADPRPSPPPLPPRKPEDVHVPPKPTGEPMVYDPPNPTPDPVYGQDLDMGGRAIVEADRRADEMRALGALEALRRKGDCDAYRAERARLGGLIDRADLGPELPCPPVTGIPPPVEDSKESAGTPAPRPSAETAPVPADSTETAPQPPQAAPPPRRRKRGE